tara:strand:+ start:4600 stop:5451 length:852 start_codon:yes stop_codon:yes gene_type:complete
VKILITGATGFIGSHLIHEIIKYKHNIIATGTRPENVLEADWLKDVDYIQADLNDKNKDWFSYFNRPDILIHLAWQGLPNYKEMFHLDNNLYNNYYFLRNIIDNGLKNVVVAGTCFEYGMQEGALKEDLETKPNNPYALAKDCLRKFLTELQNKKSFDLKWIRLFYVYGKGQNPSSLLSQLDKAISHGETVFNMSEGKQLRDYLPINIMVEYILKISLQNKVSGIVNCCSGKPISIIQLVEDYLYENNKQIKLNLGYYPYPEYEPMKFWGDNKKLNKILNEFS